MGTSLNTTKKFAGFSLTLFAPDSQRRNSPCFPLHIQMPLKVSSTRSTQSARVPRSLRVSNPNITTAVSSPVFVMLGYMPCWIPTQNARSLISVGLILTESLAPPPLHLHPLHPEVTWLPCKPIDGPNYAISWELHAHPWHLQGHL